jgi:uncharacterized protein
LYYAGKGTTEDRRVAAEIYQKACDYGHAGSCSLLATVYRDGQDGLARDERRARSLPESLQQRRHEELRPPRCHAARRPGGGLEADAKRASGLFRKACNGSDMRGCNNLSDLSTTTARSTPRRKSKATLDAQLYLMLAKD